MATKAKNLVSPTEPFLEPKAKNLVCPSEPFLERRGLKGRKMVAVEAGLFRGQELYNWMINVNAVIISCKKEITSDHVRVALRKLSQRHPHLRMRVVTGKTVLDRYLVFFETEPEPDLEVLDTEDWIATCEAEFEKNFPEETLQWRVKMLRATRDPDTGRMRYPFVFSYDHAVVDGGSIMAGINKDFHRYLEDAVCGKAGEDVESYDLLPGRETLFPHMKLTCLDILFMKLYELFKGPIVQPDRVANELMDAIKPPDSQRRSMKIVPIDFTVEETKNIVMKCREKGIKFNGFVTAAAAIASCDLIRKYVKNPEFANARQLELSTEFMYNIRRICAPPIPPDYVSILNIIIPLPISVTIVTGDEAERDAFWELAKTCHKNVHDMIGGKAPTEMAQFLNYLFRNPDAALKSFADEAKGVSSVFYLTNRGNFEVKSQYPDEDGACVFEGNYWSCAEQEMKAEVFAHSVQSVNGRMTWTLAYCGHEVAQDIAEEYSDMIRETVRKMLG